MRCRRFSLRVLALRQRVSCWRSKNYPPHPHPYSISPFAFPHTPFPDASRLRLLTTLSLAHSKQMSRYDSRCGAGATIPLPTILRRAEAFARCHVKSSLKTPARAVLPRVSEWARYGNTLPLNRLMIGVRGARWKWRYVLTTKLLWIYSK